MVEQTLKLAVGTGPADPGDHGSSKVGEVRYPLSGNVTQTINPWTWFLRLSGVDVEHLTINLGTSTNPGLEQQILQRVGTYGRQLGVLGDALGVLVEHMQDKERLDERERGALDRLLRQLDEIDELKLDPDDPRRRRRRTRLTSSAAGGDDPAPP